MYTDSLIFSQVMEHLPMHRFRRCVQRYRGNRKIKSFSCLDQFRCMAFAQLTYSRKPARYRSLSAGATRTSSTTWAYGCISRNTLANAKQDEGLAHLRRLRPSPDSHCPQSLCGPTVSVSNSTTPSTHSMRPQSISACPVFPWAQFRTTKGAVKTTHADGTCAAISLRLYMFPTANCTTSTYSIC